MRVGRPGVRVGQAGGQVRTRGISQRPQPERAVGMHPRPALPGPLDDVGEGIERAGVHLARLHADHRRAGHVLREPVGAHPPLVIGGHPADPVPAEPDQPEGLDQRGMGFLPGDHGQLRRPGQPVGLHVPAGPGQLLIAGRGKGGRVGHGRPGHERRGAAGRQAEQAGQPPGHHLMHAGRHRGHHRQRRVLIPRRRQPARRQRDGVRAAGDKAEIPAARARHGRRGSRRIQQRQRGGRVPCQLRQRLIQTREPGQRSLVRGDRAFIQVSQVGPGTFGCVRQQHPNLSVGKRRHA